MLDQVWTNGVILKVSQNSWSGKEFWPIFDIWWSVGSVQVVSEPQFSSNEGETFDFGQTTTDI